jgi:LAO/AO transport system kinase
MRSVVSRFHCFLRSEVLFSVSRSNVRLVSTSPSPVADAALATTVGGIDVELLRCGNRRSLSKAITLVESSNPRDAATIGALLRRVREGQLALGKAKRVARIAISGSPGAGKSCFVEALGMHLVRDLGLRVGVMAVDPSSAVNGGSILGDKTRMDQLSVHPNAYVRPSPSRGHLGGVTARCWETLELYELANFDVILVETVGVGQSEFEVKSLTDLFVLLVPPASGDELQGIKKGIVEMADVILVTKYDGDKKALAEATRVAYTHAVQFRQDCHVATKPVLCVSSEEKTNIPASWTTIHEMWQRRLDSGQLDALRHSQQLEHFHRYFAEELVVRALAKVGDAMVQRLEDLVVRGLLLPREAAEQCIGLSLHVDSPSTKD